MLIRPFHSDDLPLLKALTVQAFDGVSIDQSVEQLFGEINGQHWKWRKARHLDDDLVRDCSLMFVAEIGSRIVGYISTWQDREAGIGHIPNLVVAADLRGQGLGKQLIQQALSHFRECGLTHARIETLQQNAIGQHLYTSLGFREVARQIHFVCEIPRPNTPSSSDSI